MFDGSGVRVGLRLLGFGDDGDRARREITIEGESVFAEVAFALGTRLEMRQRRTPGIEAIRGVDRGTFLREVVRGQRTAFVGDLLRRRRIDARGGVLDRLGRGLGLLHRTLRRREEIGPVRLRRLCRGRPGLELLFGGQTLGFAPGTP
ncbi:Uncharacterised protein [Mycobacteroides abscessus subsp. abscessus]|nr:Uncharacterised protein [Mycobacteroides abscessus subsp. abscessus]